MITPGMRSVFRFVTVHGPLAVCRCWTAAIATCERMRRFALLATCVIGSVLTIGAARGADGTAESGQEIYTRLCVRCHGAQGEGVQGFCERKLQGSYELADLVQIVDESMPEDDPDQCTGDDARKVAQYLFETFYRPAAAGTVAPPRVELSRLTVRQYEQSIADLLGTFLGEGTWNDQRGLKAKYFANREFDGSKLALERIDGQVDFTFGEGSPDAAKIPAEEFSIQWRGAVFAEDTGDYEFLVRTENGLRLWVNRHDVPAIDAWVVSAGVTEHRVTVRLLGGRAYPIWIDFSKSKPQKTASIVLNWAPPRKAMETIPARCLAPGWFPPGCVVQQPFPPDDSSVGYVRGTTVSREWEQAQMYAAAEVAGEVSRNLARLADVKEDASDRAERIKNFSVRFAERAFRRPLTDGQKQEFVLRYWDSQAAPEVAAKQSALRVLMSPQFLYPDLAAQHDDYLVATRLALELWDSLPDGPLLEAAARGELRTKEQVVAQTHRMLGNPRARAKLRDFLHAWLIISHIDDLPKDKSLYGEFNAALASDLRTSLDLFLEDVVWSDGGDLRQLLLADSWYVNRRMAQYYGLPGEFGAEFQKVAADPERFAGILTHPYLMARFSYHKSSSPIHRGVFVIRSILGRFLKPPPIAVAPTDEGVNPNLTTRQRVAQQTNEATCQSCHGMINALGFTFEHYDAVGKYRDTEKEQAIDASGQYQPLVGDAVTFSGARQLATFLADSPETHRCFIQQVFHYLVKQPAAAYGPDTLGGLEKSFAESGFQIQSLICEIMAVTVLQPTSES